MNKKLKQAIITAQENGLTDDKLEEFLAQYKPKGMDLSNPYAFSPKRWIDRVELYFTAGKLANFECYHLRAKHILRKALDKERGDWRPNWGTYPYQKKYSPEIHHNISIDSCVVRHTNFQFFPAWVYLPSKEAWKRVIDEVGEDCVKLALFEIE